MATIAPEQSPTKRVLLTGAGGFVGRHCVPKLLECGYEVHAVSRAGACSPLRGVTWHSVDLLELPSVSALVERLRPAHLLHLAWFTVHGDYWSSPENFRWVQASLHLLQTFAEHGGRRAVFVGTCAEYDWSYGYCRERLTPLAPTTVYGACKHALQVLLESFAGGCELSAAWARLFFLFGPHEHPNRLLPAVIGALLRGTA